MEVPHPDFHSQFPLKGIIPRAISGPNQAQGPPLSPPFFQREPHSDLWPCLLLLNFQPIPGESSPTPPTPTLAESSHLSAAQLSCLLTAPQGLGTGHKEAVGRVCGCAHKQGETEAHLQGLVAGAREPGLENQPEITAATSPSSGCRSQGG